VTILSSRVVRTPFTGVADAAAVGIQLAESQFVRWSLDRSKYTPEFWVAEVDGHVAGGLTSRRPVAASRKIVDIAGDYPRARSAVRDAIISSAREEDLSRVTWELHDEANVADATAVGFERLPEPIASESDGEGPDAAVLRFTSAVPTLLRHYKQTTDFTCGAVAVSSALRRLGVSILASGTPDALRVAELDLWRRATNFPACEPIGLAVAAQAYLPAGTTPIEVYLDSAGPVLIEKYGNKEHEFRAELQTQSRADAARLGIPVHADRLSISDLLRLADDGRTVLLLIDLMPIHGYDSPHWVTAVGRDGDALLVIDPWFDKEAGESWVDAYEIPYTAESLESVAAWGPERYRGVVVFPAHS
jgi:predicted double-glycine peptidase